MPAGTYHFILDSVIIKPVDVTFDLFVRRGTTDTMLATWMRHWDPLPSGFDAQAYEIDQMCPASPAFMAGDLLVFRYSAANTTASEAYIPNGDGSLSHGRIPNFTVPQ